MSARAQFTSYKYFHLNYLSTYFLKILRHCKKNIIFLSVILLLELDEKRIRSQGGGKEINNPQKEQRKRTGKKRRGEKKVIFSFICLRKVFTVSSPSKTRIKGTGKKINDIVTEVLSLSLPMIFELYW